MNSSSTKGSSPTLRAIDRALSDPMAGADIAALVPTLMPLAPWKDVRAVRAALAGWAEKYGWQLPDSGIANVAAELARLGRHTRLQQAQRLERIVLLMLLNVRATGDPRNGGNRLNAYAGAVIPERTLRRYRKEHGQRAIEIANERLFRRAAIQGLMAGGRSYSAAREWLRTHEGSQWTEAPDPPRPPGSS
jgi:hypothetical protein